MKALFAQGKRNALLMGVLTVLLCLVLGDGLLGMVSYRDDPTMRALVVLPGITVFLVGLFLPPWLFRKTVHKRDTFWNLPLYFLAFYLLRSFFQDRVFLTQHYFLRPYISGFIYIPGEKIILPAMAVGLMWGVGWFVLSNLSQAEDPRKTRLEQAKEKQGKPEKGLFLLAGVILIFLCLGGWFTLNALVYQNKGAIEQRIQDVYGLDDIVELHFDETGTAIYRGEMDFAFDKQYGYVRLTFLSFSPIGSSQDISVVGYQKEDGEFRLSYGVYRETDEGFIPAHKIDVTDMPTFLNTVIFDPFWAFDKDQKEDYELHFTTQDPAIKTVTLHIEGMPQEFFDGYVNPLLLLLDPEVRSAIIK